VYTPQAPTLSTARDWYNGWEEYVVYGALVRLSLSEERGAGDWANQLEIQRQRIMRGAGNRRASPELIPLPGEWTLDDGFQEI
jgi:hypothetical protein